MKVTICPTITASTIEDYSSQLERVRHFAGRLHIDLMDGQFANPKSIAADQLYWPVNTRVDIHVMYKRPITLLDTFKTLTPQLIIVHAEADGEYYPFADWCHNRNFAVGIALLPDTPVSAIASAINVTDHVLIFSGRLGHQGGIADLSLLQKAKQLRGLKPQLEIGWDGGVNEDNVHRLAVAGIDVLNVGGAIQYANNPQKAYDKLESLL